MVKKIEPSPGDIDISAEELTDIFATLEGPPVAKKKFMPKKRRPLKTDWLDGPAVPIEETLNSAAQFGEAPKPGGTGDKPTTESDDAGTW